MRTIQQLFDLKGRTALITGGSRGLGLQIAEALGEQGARVVLSARKADELQAAQEHLKSRGIAAEWIAADGSRDAEIARLADEALAKLGHVDILVNNAGATWGAPAEDHPVEAWDKVMNLNIRGLFLLTQRIGKLSMIPRRSGRIINVASIAAWPGTRRVRWRPLPTTRRRAPWSTSRARWQASGASTTSPSTRWLRASSRRR
jgi:gluconate 5-dehydrogenase